MPASIQRLATRITNSLVRRYQLARFSQHHPDLAATPFGSTPHAMTSEVVRWAEEYLAKPHPQLGRKGPICPFVKHTVDIGRYFVHIHDEIDGSNIHKLRRLVLDEASGFITNSPNEGPKGSFASLVIVFPNIPENRLAILDEIHDELKTPLMERDLMFSPFHPHSTKPSISNAEFKVFRAPFAALVIRHMDVRDIAFLYSNRKAFLHFHSRFAPLFAQGKVSDEFGYVRLYQQGLASYVSN